MTSTLQSYESLIAEGARFVRSAAQSGEVLLIAHTRGAADDLLRFHCGDIAGVHRMTPFQLVAALAAEPLAERGFVPVNRLGVEALAARAVFSVRSQLDYFRPVADSPGFAAALARTILDLRLNEVRPPLPELASLLDTYEELLVERRLADYPDLARLALGEIGRHPLTGIPVLFFDAPLDSGLPARFAESLEAAAPNALRLALNPDGVKPRAARSPLDSLRSNLFATSVEAIETPDSSFEFFSAAGEGLECIEIARRIQLLARGDTRFDRIGILLRRPERYQPLLEEALMRAGVPYYFTHGAVRPDPAGRAFLALLACKLEGYTATRFAEFLAFGQTLPIGEARAMAAGSTVWDIDETAESPEPEASPATPAQWEKLIVDAAVVGGKDRWERRLRGLEEEFLIKLRQSDDTGFLERQLERLRNLQRLVLPAIERMEEMPRSATWGEWLDALTGLAQQMLAQPESVMLALNELWPMAEVGPVSLDEVYLVLTGRLRFLRRPPSRRRYGQVWAGSIDEARGQSFDVVFLPGLSEGVFPGKAYEDPLLLDEQRRRLADSLPTREDRVAEERLRLHIAAAAAARKLIVSYPRMDVVRNRPRVPSFYAMELVRAAEGRLPKIKDFEERAARDTPRLGWPAPEKPAASIDPLEFDLATLHFAIRSKTKGAARHLLTANPHLARSLRSRYMRWNSTWSEADGLVGKDAAMLDRYRLKQRPWSASTLQLFASCPYRFALHGIFKLKPREESVPLEEMDPLIRGELFHRVQFELFQLMQAGEDMADVADEVLDDVAAEFADRLAPAIPRVWQGEVEDLRADLHGWIRRYREDATGWEPAYSELAFGLPLDDGGRDPQSRPEPVTILDGMLVRGSIDWIEWNADRNKLRITDHKTGKPPRQRPAYVGGGTTLQPLLYAMAAEARLGLAVAFSRLYFCTQRGGYTPIELSLRGDARDKLEQALRLIDESVSQGRLPASPAKDACTWCDFAMVCGPREEERVERKPKLANLETLRGMQ